jgi:hypothetical protein
LQSRNSIQQRRNNLTVIPPNSRPRVIFRYADAKDLLISGWWRGGNEIAQHANATSFF